MVDTTGAGDCFTGAYAVGILEGKAPEEALEFAGWCPMGLYLHGSGRLQWLFSPMCNCQMLVLQ